MGCPTYRCPRRDTGVADDAGRRLAAAFAALADDS